MAIALHLFCVISGELASSAFKIKTDNNVDVSDLKKAIWADIKTDSETIKPNDLTLWRVAITTGRGVVDKLISADDIESKEVMMGGAAISDYFETGASEKTIHIIVKRPKAAIPQNLESEARIAKLLEEVEDLRGGKSIMVLNVIVRPNRSESFSWTTDIETVKIKELERAIYAEYPDREDGEAVLAVIHTRGTPQHEAGGTERPSDDEQFRKILQQYRKTNTRTLTVALETPTKKYTDFTLTEVNTLYEISNLEGPDIPDLPPFDGISSETLDTDLHKESLRRLLDELDSRIRAIPSHTLNEATCSAYVCSFLAQAVLVFNGDLTLAPERRLRGRHGHGKIDYSIESLADDGTRHILGVTEVKQEDFRKGVAQNLVQLESSLTVRKRKRCDDDDGENELVDDAPVPLKAYGIVTDAVNWYFLECSIDQSQEFSSKDLMRPKFRISKLQDMVNYQKSTWRDDATAVLSQIVWLMRKMHAEIPRREITHKRQKGGSSTRSTLSKMQRT